MLPISSLNACYIRYKNYCPLDSVVYRRNRIVAVLHGSVVPVLLALPAMSLVESSEAEGNLSKGDGFRKNITNIVKSYNHDSFINSRIVIIVH